MCDFIIIVYTPVLENRILRTEGTFSRFQDLIFQSIERTDQFLHSVADLDWLRLKVGEFRTPVSTPTPGHGFSLTEKRNLRLVTACELCFG